MPAAHLTLTAIFSILLLSASSSPIVQKSDDAEEDSPYDNGAFLEEDREIAKWVSKAHAHLIAGQFPQGLEILQRIIDKGQDSVVSQDNEGRLYRPVRDHCHRLIASLPPDGLAAYRLVADVEARRVFEEARAQRSPEGLSQVASRYFCSTVGDDALELAGDIHLDRREYDQALRSWSRIEPLYPSEKETNRSYLLAKMAFAASRLGLAEQASTYLDDAIERAGDQTFRFAGEEVPMESLRSHLLLGFEEPPPPDPKEWPMAGGDATHSRLAPSIPIGIGDIVNWRIPFEWSEEQPPPKVPGITINSAPISAMPSTVTVVSDGIVITRAGETLIAAELRTGKRKWDPSIHEERRFEVPPSPSGTGVRLWLPSRHPGLSSITIDDGMVFVTEGGGLAGSSAGQMFGIPQAKATPNSLAAYHLDDGRLIWRREEGGLYFAYAPTPWGGRLYLPAEEEGELFVVAVDPHDGSVLWKTFICGSPGDGPVQSGIPVAVSGGLVYCLSSVGAVGAVDALDGSLEWVARYPRLAQGANTAMVGFGRGQVIAVQGKNFVFRGGAGGPFTGTRSNSSPVWAPSAPIVANGRLLIAPADSNYLLCLDARTGEEKWPIRKERGQTYLLGVTSRLLFVGGRRTFAYEIESGKLVWAEPSTRERDSGRGAVSAGHVYIPVEEAVICLDAVGGKRLDEYRLPEGEESGNLTIVEGTLLVAGRRAIAAFKLEEKE